MRIAVCPGSFDPVTLGHMDIINRASTLFDKVIVLVSVNSSKKYAFTAEERVELLKKVTGNLENVVVESDSGLLADYLKKKNATAIVKGLRAVTDFEYEFQMALTNKMLNPDLETVFLTTSSKNMYLSSSMVKQVASLGGDISSFVPSCVLDRIVDRLSAKE